MVDNERESGRTANQTAICSISVIYCHTRQDPARRSVNDLEAMNMKILLDEHALKWREFAKPGPADGSYFFFVVVALSFIPAAVVAATALE